MTDPPRPMDEVTKLKLRLAIPETQSLLRAVALAEIERFGRDFIAKLVVTAALYEEAIALHMHTTGRSRRDTVLRLSELGLLNAEESAEPAPPPRRQKRWWRGEWLQQ